MNILVCFKYIPDEDEISINPDKTVNLSRAAWVVSPYDLNAIEAAMSLSRAVPDGKTAMLTVAGDVLDNSKMKKSALARGPESLYAVRIQDQNAVDNLTVASLLKAAVEKMGDVDIIICGEGSGDMYSQQLGNVLGGMLGWPTLNAVSGLSYADGKVMAERTDGNRTETYAIGGKAVLSVTSDICRPHIPTMKEIMGSGKKPMTIWDAGEFTAEATVTSVASVLAPEKAVRKKIMFHESDEAEFDEFCKVLKSSI